MEEILTWANLGTAAGVSAAVVTLTQILKRYIPKIDPKWIALVLSVIITFTNQFIHNDFLMETFILSALNAIISAGTAIGAYEGIISPIAHRDSRMTLEGFSKETMKNLSGNKGDIDNE